MLSINRRDLPQTIWHLHWTSSPGLTVDLLHLLLLATDTSCNTYSHSAHTVTHRDASGLHTMWKTIKFFLFLQCRTVSHLGHSSAFLVSLCNIPSNRTDRCIMYILCWYIYNYQGGEQGHISYPFFQGIQRIMIKIIIKFVCIALIKSSITKCFTQ